MAAYEQFVSFFAGRQLPTGMRVVMFWSVKGELQLAALPAGTNVRCVARVFVWAGCRKF